MSKNEKAKEYVDTKELVLMSYSPEYIDDVKEDMSIAFIRGYEQAEKVTIEKACLWLKTHLYCMESVEEIDMFNELFKKAMEEE